MTVERFMTTLEKQAVDPFTGESDSGESVTDIIKDELEVDIDEEVSEQLKLLSQDLDVIHLYKRYLEDDKGQLNDLEKLALRLSIKSLTHKIELVNSNILGSLDTILHKNFNMIQVKALNIFDVRDYLKIKMPANTTMHFNPKDISICTESCKDIMAKVDHITFIEEQLATLHELAVSTESQEVITEEMYSLFSRLASVGFDISIVDNRLSMKYNQVTTPRKLDTLGYLNMNNLKESYHKLIGACSCLNYDNILNRFHRIKEEFKLGLESFNTSITTNKVEIGDTSYIENFTNMVIYKKRMIVLSKIMNANLSALSKQLQNFGIVLSSIERESTVH